MARKCPNRIALATRMGSIQSRIHNRTIVFITRVTTKEITSMIQAVVKNIIHPGKIIKSLPLEKQWPMESNWEVISKELMVCN